MEGENRSRLNKYSSVANTYTLNLNLMIFLFSFDCFNFVFHLIFSLLGCILWSLLINFHLKKSLFPAVHYSHCSSLIHSSRLTGIDSGANAKRIRAVQKDSFESMNVACLSEHP